MTKRLYSLFLLLCMTFVVAEAQETVYLVKGKKVVAKYPIADVDYLTFALPDSVQDGQSVEVQAVATGKNFIQYKVVTKDPSQYYGHYFFQAAVLDNMLRSYYNTTIDEADAETLNYIVRLLVGNYGYMDQGTQTFKITNGENDGQGRDFFIPAGQDFYVATVNVTEVSTAGGTLGDEVSLAKLTTLSPAESQQTISVSFLNLDDEGNVTYDIKPSDGIVTLYTMFANKRSLDQAESIYGADYVLFNNADAWTSTDWASYGDQQAWEIDGENDYVMTVVGYDTNGDRVLVQDEQHLTPSTNGCPAITVGDKSASNGAVSINFSIDPKTVSAAHVRLMLDNDLSNALNVAGATLDQVAIAGDAEDITTAINADGTYTFTRTGLSRGWYTLLVSATTDEGTTVTKVSFHTHLGDSTWEIDTDTFPTSGSASAPHKKAAFGSRSLNGNKLSVVK